MRLIKIIAAVGALWFLVGFAVSTFSPSLLEARGAFIGSCIAFVVAGLGVQVAREKSLHYRSRSTGDIKTISFSPRGGTATGTAAVFVGLGMFAVFGAQWSRLIAQADDWSRNIPPGVLLLWTVIAAMAVIALVNWKRKA